MARYFHNATKKLVNETDATDFLDVYEDGDTIFVSYSGNAMLHYLTESDVRKLKLEFDYEED